MSHSSHSSYLICLEEMKTNESSHFRKLLPFQLIIQLKIAIPKEVNTPIAQKKLLVVSV